MVMVFPSPSVAPLRNDVAFAVSQDDGAFREDGHSGPVVRHYHCAAFTIRQHHITLSIPGRDDVAIGTQHHARTVCGFDDGVALLVGSKVISPPHRSTLRCPWRPLLMMLPSESSTTPDLSAASTILFPYSSPATSPSDHGALSLSVPSRDNVGRRAATVSGET